MGREERVLGRGSAALLATQKQPHRAQALAGSLSALRVDISDPRSAPKPLNHTCQLQKFQLLTAISGPQNADDDPPPPISLSFPLGTPTLAPAKHRNARATPDHSYYGNKITATE
ncbi:hypothetical protein AAFF_G00228610 [Aldrovandia affinis]|uniref:Uncharacterized protein n=1 Tax=Aldrovandia affinis TaxID=143900 RepID=A0AAD7SVI7_9TELE|nr:hypothetical protein AAFF_G00228610 [Aldrovandia affinis]